MMRTIGRPSWHGWRNTANISDFFSGSVRTTAGKSLQKFPARRFSRYDFCIGDLMRHQLTGNALIKNVTISSQKSINLIQTSLLIVRAGRERQERQLFPAGAGFFRILFSLCLLFSRSTIYHFGNQVHRQRKNDGGGFAAGGHIRER